MLCSLKWMFYYADRFQFACATFFLSLYTPRLPEKKTLDIQPEAWAVAKFFRLPSFSKRSLFRKVFDNKNILTLGRTRVEVCNLCFDRLDQKIVCFDRLDPGSICFDRLDPSCLCVDYVRPRKNISPLLSEKKGFDQVRSRKKFRPSWTEEFLGLMH